MNPEIAELLDKLNLLPPDFTPARERLSRQVLEGTGITNFTQVAALIEALGAQAARENGETGDHESAEALFEAIRTISDSCRQLHELIQELA